MSKQGNTLEIPDGPHIHQADVLTTFEAEVHEQEIAYSSGERVTGNSFPAGTVQFPEVSMENVNTTSLRALRDVETETDLEYYDSVDDVFAE